MKHQREHRVPLSTRAGETLDGARENAVRSEWVFPSPKGQPLSDSVFHSYSRANVSGGHLCG